MPLYKIVLETGEVNEMFFKNYNERDQYIKEHENIKSVKLLNKFCIRPKTYNDNEFAMSKTNRTKFGEL